MHRTHSNQLITFLSAIALSTTSLVALTTQPVMADVTFNNIAGTPGSGLDYEREPSATFALNQQILQDSLTDPLDFTDVANMPYNTYGQPGVIIFDYDRDGDLDIYVTNGPGVANSLFSNQLQESGALTFVDVATSAGIAAVDQDGMGVCYGDIDNDGDDDVYVLGRDEPNRLFINDGAGGFTVAVNSGVDQSSLSSPSCAMGDINGDGLLDIAVANAYDHGDLLACTTVPFALNQPNELFLNQGNLTFTDVSVSSGILNLGGMPPGAQGITWTVGMLDIDRDGDTDIVFGDDRCALATTLEDPVNGVDRGFLHVFANDGNGVFTDSIIAPLPEVSGSWMGLAFGDLNCDSHIDIFGSNFGDYHNASLGNMGSFLGNQASRWFLGSAQGNFSDPGVGSLISTAFGWGNAIVDYDNDGDLDIIYGGGIDDAFIMLTDNPGIVLRNDDCTGNFSYDLDAIQTDDTRRVVQGLAVGDLDRNGFPDLVTAAGLTIPQNVPLSDSPVNYGAPLDDFAFFVPILGFTPGGLVWTGVEFARGNIAVEISDADNDNGWIEVTLQGSVGITSGGVANRSGIGAVLEVTPKNGHTVSKPVVGGASFGSQHTLELTFGYGNEKRGVVDVFWPGGVRNRLYNVRDGERILFPEIPCSFDDTSLSFPQYRQCVKTALNELRSAGVISLRQKVRHFVSAMRAYLEFN